MRRISCKPRADWESKIASLGLTFNNVPVDDKVVPYWIDDAVYFFSFKLMEEIKTATSELHNLCLNFVDQACRHDELLASLRIPESYWAYIRSSWNDRAPSLYGRFDLHVDPTGTDAPKMYEYNADTPTILIESSLVQANWLDEQCDNIPDVDQFNDIHDLLVQRWKAIKQKLAVESDKLYLSCVPNHEEDARTTEYIADAADEAGWNVCPITIDQVGWDTERQQFVDLDNNPIKYWFKLYPWENLASEDFGPHMTTKTAPVTFEPVWKMLLSNKASLPLLWKLNPGHKNLLPCFFSEEEAMQQIPSGSLVSKPIFGREGANVSIFEGKDLRETSSGVYGKDPVVWQQCCMPPKFGDYHAVVGSWIVGDTPAGICVREDPSPITKNVSRFVSHVFG